LKRKPELVVVAEVLTQDSRKLPEMTDSLSQKEKDTHTRNHELANEFMELIKLQHPVLHQEVPILVHPLQEIAHLVRRGVEQREAITEEDKLKSFYAQKTQNFPQLYFSVCHK